jgi:hypothetical protein
MANMNGGDAWEAFERQVMKSRDGWKKVGRNVDSGGLEDVSGRVVKNRVASVKGTVDTGGLEDKTGKVTFDELTGIECEIDYFDLRVAPDEVQPDELDGIFEEVDTWSRPDLSGRVIVNTTDEITVNINTDDLPTKHLRPHSEATDFTGEH